MTRPLPPARISQLRTSFTGSRDKSPLSARSKLPPRPVLSFSSPSPARGQGQPPRTVLASFLFPLLSPDSLLQIFSCNQFALRASHLRHQKVKLVSRRLCVVGGSVERRFALAVASLSMASSVVSSAAVFAAPGMASFSSSVQSFSTSSAVRMAPVNRRLSVVAMATPQNKEDIKDLIPNAIAEAQKTCEDDPTSAPCAVAWDEVEELTAEASHQRDRKKTTSDPLEAYCADNPEADECRTYED